ncbi:UAA transporter, partial [Infundibulicybe gibba]
NAITLEQLTSQYPNAGSLITLLQFIIISVHGLPKHIFWTRYGPRFKPRRIPLTPYLAQVILFYFISLLNNAAFAYQIPMAVHIYSAAVGLSSACFLDGWLLARGRSTYVTSLCPSYLNVYIRYSLTQIVSVLLVTFGVILTTLSASNSENKTTTDMHTYAQGIAILSLALLFSGFLGLVQDWTYSKHGRPAIPGMEAKGKPKPPSSPGWQESMFYLHFLSLPMFFFLRSDLQSQFTDINAGPKSSFSFPFLSSYQLATYLPPQSFISLKPSASQLLVRIPTAYLPLLVNTLTQLLCVAGVHRLTTRVSALSVTLVLVVRKAVSLILSVMGLGVRGGPPQVDMLMIWSGAALVLIGTVGYTIGSRGDTAAKTKRKKE